MKALIRREGETVTDAMQIEGIDWNTGFPLTQKDWPGGAYTLVDNYVAEEEVNEDGLGDSIHSNVVPPVDAEESTVVSEEKEVTAPQTYTLSEAKRLLGLE